MKKRKLEGVSGLELVDAAWLSRADIPVRPGGLREPEAEVRTMRCYVRSHRRCR